MERYAPHVEETMRCFYAGLNEKDRRLYAGIEALKYGRGGRAYIAGVLGCSRNTVSKGAREVSGSSSGPFHPSDRLRYDGVEPPGTARPTMAPTSAHSGDDHRPVSAPAA